MLQPWQTGDYEAYNWNNHLHGRVTIFHQYKGYLSLNRESFKKYWLEQLYISSCSINVVYLFRGDCRFGTVSNKSHCLLLLSPRSYFKSLPTFLSLLIMHSSSYPYSDPTMSCFPSLTPSVSLQAWQRKGQWCYASDSCHNDVLKGL